jgi:hypothetical protein
MTGYEFAQGRFQHVPWMIRNTDEFYETKVVPKGFPGKFALTAIRIVESRGWQPTERLFKSQIEDVLRELNYFYVPKQIQPGPAFVFPLRDIQGPYRVARMKPLFDLIINGTPARYAFLGNKHNVLGPNWLGMSPETIGRIIEKRFVCLVEGPFDQLACRLMAPDVPTISTGTKTFNEKHMAYLRLLGVRRVYLMFDNDELREGKQLGAGEIAAERLKGIWTHKLEGLIDIRKLQPPAADPSDCLKALRSALSLRDTLRNMNGN